MRFNIALFLLSFSTLSSAAVELPSSLSCQGPAENNSTLKMNLVHETFEDDYYALSVWYADTNNRLVGKAARYTVSDVKNANGNLTIRGSTYFYSGGHAKSVKLDIKLFDGNATFTFFADRNLDYSVHCDLKD